MQRQIDRLEDPVLRIVPEPETAERSGDHLVVIGERGSLEKLAQLAQAPASPRAEA